MGETTEGAVGPGRRIMEAARALYVDGVTAYGDTDLLVSPPRFADAASRLLLPEAALCLGAARLSVLTLPSDG